MGGGKSRSNGLGATKTVDGLFGPELVREPERRRAADRPASPAATANLFVEVALNRPMRREYTYAVPAELEERVEAGVRVVVSFSGRREIAVVVSTQGSTDVPKGRLKPIVEVLDAEPVLDQHLLDLTRWMADYYACSWGEALAAVLPAALKREGGRRTVVVVAPADGVDESRLAELEGAANAKQHRVLRTLLEARGPIARVDIIKKLNVTDAPIRTLVKKGLAVLEHVVAAPDDLLSGEREARPRHAQLTEDQGAAVARLTEALDEQGFCPALLHGVTGSGKTEVYLPSCWCPRSRSRPRPSVGSWTASAPSRYCTAG